MKVRKRMSGFTLVEILIVVVILGILAAIVIPQFSNASESAKASSLISQLQTLRGQLELAQIQHQGAYPDITGDGTDDAQWQELTQETEQLAAYTLATAGDGVASNDVGPYIQQPSINPFENSFQTVAPGGAAAGVAWEYNVNTGAIRAVLANQKAIDLGLVPAGHAAGAAHPDIITY